MDVASMAQVRVTGVGPGTGVIISSTPGGLLPPQILPMKSDQAIASLPLAWQFELQTLRGQVVPLQGEVAALRPFQTRVLDLEGQVAVLRPLRDEVAALRPLRDEVAVTQAQMAVQRQVLEDMGSELLEAHAVVRLPISK